MRPAHRAIVLTPTQSGFFGFSKTVMLTELYTHTYTKQVFDLSKRHAQRAIVLTPTQSRFLTSQRGMLREL